MVFEGDLCPAVATADMIKSFRKRNITANATSYVIATGAVRIEIPRISRGTGIEFEIAKKVISSLSLQFTRERSRDLFGKLKLGSLSLCHTVPTCRLCRGRWV